MPLLFCCLAGTIKSFESLPLAFHETLWLFLWLGGGVGALEHRLELAGGRLMEKLGSLTMHLFSYMRATSNELVWRTNIIFL